MFERSADSTNHQRRMKWLLLARWTKWQRRRCDCCGYWKRPHLLGTGRKKRPRQRLGLLRGLGLSGAQERRNIGTNLTQRRRGRRVRNGEGMNEALCHPI